MPFYGKRRMRMVAVKKSGKYTPRRKNYSKKPKVSFNAKVQKIIASNIENKITSTLVNKGPVGKLIQYSLTDPVFTTPQVYQLYTFSPNSIFNLPQGTGMSARVGNKIKIKRWVIKGLIQPNDTFNQTAATSPSSGTSTTGIAPNTLAGYVDIYFGRYANNIAPITSVLGMTNFYQSGAVDITPTGNTQEQLYNVNKDLYHIYYHKRIKVGTGTGFIGPSSGPLIYEPVATTPGANGFGLTKSFGFDVCKYICKNRVVKYDESVQTPQDADLENLTLFAIFHPAAGNVLTTAVSASPPNGANSVNQTFYDMNVMSYAEYEDA